MEIVDLDAYSSSKPSIIDGNCADKLRLFVQQRANREILQGRHENVLPALYWLLLFGGWDGELVDCFVCIHLREEKHGT